MCKTRVWVFISRVFWFISQWAQGPKWMRRMLFIRPPSPPSWRICFILWELCEIEVKACYFQTKIHMKRPREGSGIWALDFSRRLCVPLKWTAYCGLCRGVWLGFWVVLGFRHKLCEIFPWKVIAVYGKWYFFTSKFCLIFYRGGGP